MPEVRHPTKRVGRDGKKYPAAVLVFSPSSRRRSRMKRSGLSAISNQLVSDFADTLQIRVVSIFQNRFRQFRIGVV